MSNYPIIKARSNPASGINLYLHLLREAKSIGSLPHEVWHAGEKSKLIFPDKYPFRGFFPIGKTLNISYGGSALREYTFTGEEKNDVYVMDLSPEAKDELEIPPNAKDKDKVFNPNFVPYDDLSEETKISNELPTIALAKSIDAYLSERIGPYYSEQNIVDFLLLACEDASSEEMIFMLHANHVVWCAQKYMTTGLAPDMEKQFFTQDDEDFYIKDVGTLMPSILYALTMLGQSPINIVNELSFDLWQIDLVAAMLEPLLKVNQEQATV